MCHLYKLVLVLSVSFIPFISHAESESPQLWRLAHDYFERFNKTQQPTSTVQDVEYYLELLADDVGFQHLPWRTGDTRKPTGKETLRKGMKHWLGGKVSYDARLLDVLIAYDLVVIKYESILVLPLEEGKTKTIVRRNTETLEIENGKVSVIRKYGEN